MSCRECYRHGFSVAFTAGWCTAKDEIAAGIASRLTAKERRYLQSSINQNEWDDGYYMAVAMYRVGHDLNTLYELGNLNGVMPLSHYINNLLDGTLTTTVRSDPRKL